MTGRQRTTAPEHPSTPSPAAAVVPPERTSPLVPTDADPEAVADQLRLLAPAARAEAVRGLQSTRGNRWMEGIATGRPIPDATRARMEGVFGADFSDVSVREDDGPDALHAAAFTRGSEIVFSRGGFDMDRPEGLAVLGHELAHVLQQRAGRVPGDGVTEDPALEAEADRAGERAARGEPVGVLAAAGPGPATGGAPATQPLPKLKLPAFLRRSRGAAPAPAPQAAEPPPYMTVQLSPEPTEKLEQLRSRFLSLKSQFNREHEPAAKAALYTQVKAALEDIGDAYDEYEGNPGLGQRLRASGAARAAELESTGQGGGGGGSPLYQRSPADDPCGPAEGAYASPHLPEPMYGNAPESQYASPHLPEPMYGNAPESQYASPRLPEPQYANYPPEALAGGAAVPPARKAAARRPARQPRPNVPTPFIPSYRRRG